MPHLLNHTPTYRKHSASGQAIVTLNGHNVYLGPHGSRASRIEYDRIIAEWLANGRQYHQPETGGLTVAEIMVRYYAFACEYYRRSDGTLTSEPSKIKAALRPVRRLYGHTTVSDFGPLCLKALQQEMIQLNWCRNFVNQSINVIRRMFKWAVENELVPGNMYYALQAVSPLKSGRSSARESKPVRPVPEGAVEPVLPHVSRPVAAMIRLQRLSGMRPGEVVIMRSIDVDTTGPLWLYRPMRHKTSHLGHERVIFLGPKAKQIVGAFLKADTAAYLFTPIDAEADRRIALHDARKTPLSCGNRPGSNRQRQPKWLAGDHYSVKSYARSVQYGCDAAFPPPDHLARRRVPRSDGKNGERWETLVELKTRLGEKGWAERRQWQQDHRWHPHQLRHTAATELRKTFGLEAAQVILGHKTLSVTQVYAEKNIEAAMKIMSEVG